MNKQIKSIIIYSVVVGIVLIFSAWLIFIPTNNDSGVSKSSASTLSIATDNFDFGTVPMEDGNVLHDFKVVNNGKEPVTINEVFTSCACTTAFIIDANGTKYGKFGMRGHGLKNKTSIEIAPGESAIVQAVYDPAYHGPSGVGLVQRSVYLDTNSSKSPKLEVSFKALVTRNN